MSEVIRPTENLIHDLQLVYMNRDDWSATISHSWLDASLEC